MEGTSSLDRALRARAQAGPPTAPGTEPIAGPGGAVPGPAGPRKLGELLGQVPEARLRGEPEAPVAGLAYRSSDVRPGWLFFCVPGTRADGHDFAPQAVAAGAAALVVERWLELPCAQVLVPSVRRAMGPISAAFYGHPSRGMTLVGVTGTNGKTTFTYLMESVFRAMGLTPGLVGTTGVRVAGRPIPFERTTPEAPDLQRILAEMLGQGVEAAAMEVSSHGLDQRRVDGTWFATVVFTNLSQDHLDYHGTMEAYFEAKARLFDGTFADRGAVNADSPYGRRLLARAPIPLLTYGLAPDADLRAEDVEVGPAGLSFRVGGTVVRSRLRGLFNVSNCLAAVAAARQVGVDEEAIVAGIAALPGVPGRLEPVECGQPFQVLVDYAHTPDSLENVLRAARELAAGRVIVVFGCGGDRDRGKRPLMGEASTRLADLSVVTSDNPRSEDPLSIIREVETGARRGGGRYLVEPDRRAAIALALAEARPGDVVLIAGKGHETGQEFADRVVPFDDRAVAREELAGLGWSLMPSPTSS
ncbi:MAG TPA: UDP-N-acetylmuramoyl-L-alanyl-D-glutamate--2,6-diaminopimelate ligase [Actinomycetota bacterium]|nr:UDP-N-acetylmuramoyl-L-alanyl-D-glutamate--2,6-diaminopimelate ligase [Actinomycetota bacterium]